jgi:tellurite resistance-related uncharacterized protein
MTRLGILNLILLSISLSSFSQNKLRVELREGHDNIFISSQNNLSIQSPEEGLWSIATAWKDDWPANWQHAHPNKITESGDWTILSGEMEMDGGKWVLRDAYRLENGMIKCIRRFEWQGEKILNEVTLSVRWQVKGEKLQAFLPGILYYGNPSGEKNRPEWVPWYHGDPGEMAIFEEHRYPMPFACLESGKKRNKFGAAIHTIPSPLKDKNLPDHWWSMGVTAHDAYSELTLLSGPITYNNVKSVAKALQPKQMKYGNTYLNVEPGTVIEKTYYLDIYPIEKQGTAFQEPIYKSLDIFKPYYSDDLPTFNDIIKSKLKFSKSRWIDDSNNPGFSMYPAEHGKHIVMGWCGQAASCGYAYQELDASFPDPSFKNMIQESLDFLTNSPVLDEGFPVRYDVKNSNWHAPDHVSMGQGMYNIAKAIEAARKNGKYDTRKWEKFLKKACDVTANRILDSDWSPRSTAEGFHIAPLALAYKLFGTQKYFDAALKGASYYANRHLSMEEPYWGGTLDANGEDKEGAWAAFQGFLAVYEMTGEAEHLEWAKHACDVCLSYVVNWDIPLPPGRMADHNFKTRGWTVVSPQNQHIDIFGVFYTPEIYKMGQILNDERLKKLAIVMYRTCGQLIDPFGSQGEQLQHTNFAQHGDMSDVYKLRGGYSESWTVFWITAHFLNAAARFQELGVNVGL